MKELFVADQRLVMLRFLTESNGHTANDSILDDVLDQYGHKISRNKVRAHMRFLEDAGLITINSIGEKTLVATVTQHGADVAMGEASADGVKRPAPGDF